MASGWVKLDRQIRNHWLWSNHEYAFAWVDIILMANHDDKKINFNGKILTIKKGQFLTSIRKLSEQWGWSKDKTLRYMRLLEKDNMIRRDTETVSATLITIVNYGKYQGRCDTNKYSNKYTNKDTDKDTNEPQTRIIKNNKEIKEYISCAESDDYVSDEEWQRRMQEDF